jgi:hypothetical protein
MEAANLSLVLFDSLGFLAIAAGGCLVAFSAKKPTRLINWTSAYLILIVGLVQVGFGHSLNYLAHGASIWLPILAFAAYNFGNFGVILGTVQKYKGSKTTPLVNIGGLLLATSMVIMLAMVWGSSRSWQLVIFVIASLTILVSMPIGLAMSRKRGKIELKTKF